MKGSNAYGVPMLRSDEVFEHSIPQGSPAAMKWPSEVPK